MRKNIEKLKEQNPILEIIRAAGYSFEKEGKYYQCQEVPGLTVNAQSGRYYWNDPDGELIEHGDVIQWLKNRMAWSFLQAVNFLEQWAQLSDRERKEFSLLGIEGARLEDKEEDDQQLLGERLGKIPVDKDGTGSGVRVRREGEDLLVSGPGFEYKREWSEENEARKAGITYSDRRLDQAVRALHDFSPNLFIRDVFRDPEQLARVGSGPMYNWKQLWSSVNDEIRSLPTRFIKIHGIPEYDECISCGREIKRPWHYLPYEPKEEGLEYCQACFEKVERWHEGLWKLWGYLSEMVDLHG